MLLNKADQAIIIDLIIDNSKRHHSNSECMLQWDLELIEKVKQLELEETDYQLHGYDDIQDLLSKLRVRS